MRRKCREVLVAIVQALRHETEIWACSNARPFGFTVSVHACLSFSARALLLSIFLALTLPVWAQGTPAKAAEVSAGARDIAGAGTVRLRAQRLAKLYQQAELGLNSPAAARQIGEAVAHTDADLKRLERYGKGPQNVATTSERIQEALAAVTAKYAQDFTGNSGKVRQGQVAAALVPSRRWCCGTICLP